MNRVQKWCATIGMGLIMLGLVAALCHLLGLDTGAPETSEQLVPEARFKTFEIWRQWLFVVGAMFLAVVAWIGKRWLFMVLEASLILWGLLFFVQDPSLLWSARIFVFVATWFCLWRVGLLTKEHIWGALGIEALGTGYLTGIFLMHCLGGVLLCLYSIQGMRSADRTVVAVSKFWLILNIPFAALSLVESGIQIRNWLS